MLSLSDTEKNMNESDVGVIFPRTIFVPGERGITGNQNFPRGIPGEPNLPTNFTTKTEKWNN